MAPILYTFGGSVWAAAPELAALELASNVEKKVINLFKGENLSPSFLKINPEGTIPTLEAEGKVYTNTTDVVAYLVNNASTKVKSGDAAFIKAIHENSLDPNFALTSTISEEEIKAKAASIPGVFISNRQEALLKYAAGPDAAEFKDFYAAKITRNGGLDSIYKGVAREGAKLNFIEVSKKFWVDVGTFVSEALPAHLPESGFIGGSVPGEDDFYVAAWLGRIAATKGAAKTEDGLAALEAFSPLDPKLASYWNSWIARSSWQMVYAEGLH